MPFQSMIRHGLIITLNVITGTSALRREIFYLDEYADRGIRPISGVDLTLNRDMTFLGDTDQYGQLTCRAIGNDVTINSVTVSWVNLTGKSVDLLRVTTNRPSRTVSLDGMLGNGTLQGNTGYIFIHQVDAAACDTSYFLCEVNFTKQSGESGRAFAAAWPRQIQSSQPTHASLEEKLSDLSAAFGKLNQSYTSLLRDLREGQRLNANISAKTTELEGRLSSQICDPCSNLTDSLEDVKRRLELLDISNTPTGDGDGGDTTNTPTRDGDGDYTTNTPTGDGDDDDTTNTPTGGGDGDDTTNTPAGDGDGTDTTNTPLEVVMAATLRTLPLEVVMAATLRTLPLEVVMVTTLRTLPLEVVMAPTLRTLPLEVVMVTTLRTLPLEMVMVTTLRTLPLEVVMAATL